MINIFLNNATDIKSTDSLNFKFSSLGSAVVIQPGQSAYI